MRRMRGCLCRGVQCGSRHAMRFMIATRDTTRPPLRFTLHTSLLTLNVQRLTSVLLLYRLPHYARTRVHAFKACLRALCCIVLARTVTLSLFLSLLAALLSALDVDTTIRHTFIALACIQHHCYRCLPHRITALAPAHTYSDFLFSYGHATRIRLSLALINHAIVPMSDKTSHRISHETSPHLIPHRSARRPILCLITLLSCIWRTNSPTYDTLYLPYRLVFYSYIAFRNSLSPSPCRSSLPLAACRFIVRWHDEIASDATSPHTLFDGHRHTRRSMKTATSLARSRSLCQFCRRATSPRYADVDADAPSTSPLASSIHGLHGAMALFPPGFYVPAPLNSPPSPLPHLLSFSFFFCLCFVSLHFVRASFCGATHLIYCSYVTTFWFTCYSVTL